MNNLFSFDSEFFIFILIENLLIIAYLVFYRYSRNHGGVFDRRVSERRMLGNRTSWRVNDRRLADLGFTPVKIGVSGSNQFFEVETDRRVGERRTLSDRRNILNNK